MKFRTRDITLCAMLVALSLALSLAERMIPLEAVIPLPGVKLGLANIVTMFALYELGGRYALAVLVCRCALASLFGGGFTALAFSLAGGLLALAAMALARRAPFLSVYGVSLCGAACHNTGQILAAMALLALGDGGGVSAVSSPCLRRDGPAHGLRRVLHIPRARCRAAPRRGGQGMLTQIIETILPVIIDICELMASSSWRFPPPARSGTI